MDRQIVDHLKSMICDLTHLKKDEVGIEDNLFDDLGIDSVSALQILAAVEEKYGINLEDWDLVNYDTIEKIVIRVERHIYHDLSGSIISN